MKSTKLFSVLLGLSLACCLSAVPQEKGLWRAASRTAQGITGDIGISSEKITINLASFILAQIRALQPAEAAAVFDLGPDAAGVGNLYRTSIPGDRRFLRKNTLCGAEETDWVVTYVSGRNLQVALFSGSKVPDLTRDGIANSGSLCGTFSYVK